MTVQGPIGFGGLAIQSGSLGVLADCEPKNKGCRRLKLHNQAELLQILKYFWEETSSGVGQNMDILHELPTDWDARDQGHLRGTCVSFASLSAAELYRYWNCTRTEAEDFSEELLYALMREKFDLREHFPDLAKDGEVIPGYDDLGASLLWQAGSALDAYGAGPEEKFPYEWSETEPGYYNKDLADDVPTADMVPISDDREHAVVEMPYPKDRPADRISDSVRYLLSRKTPVCLSFPVLRYLSGYNEWTFPPGWTTGQIPNPAESPADATDGRMDTRGGHSVCIVGYCADPNTENDGWFVFRNSWGRRFAPMADFVPKLPIGLERGYGMISSRHVNEFCWEMMFLIPKE